MHSQFTLQEETARHWITDLIVASELYDVDTVTNRSAGIDPVPRVGMSWQPRAPGQEDNVSALVRCSQHKHLQVFDRPGNAVAAIEFLDDGDDWCYHFLLKISGPAPLTLVSEPVQISRLGDDAAEGAAAAIGILHETQQVANELLKQLDSFVTSTRSDS